MSRMSVKEAAERLGVSISAIHYGLQQCTLPIGWAVKHPDRWAYYIKKQWVEDFISGRRLAPERQEQ